MNTRLMERWIESGSEIARLSAEGTATYWTGAAGPRGLAVGHVRRRPPLVDRGEPPRAPALALAERVVLECPVARLRDFSQGSKADVVPTLVLPPQAGHDSCIVDYSPAQSQMKVIRAAGLERAFSLEWIGATAETRDAGIEDYLELHRALDRAHRRPGQPDRRLPGRLAGRDLRGAASRARQHADARGRADRLPRRRRRDRRLGRGARRRRPRVLPLGRSSRAAACSRASTCSTASS